MWSPLRSHLSCQRPNPGNTGIPARTTRLFQPSFPITPAICAVCQRALQPGYVHFRRWPAPCSGLPHGHDPILSGLQNRPTRCRPVHAFQPGARSRDQPHRHARAARRHDDGYLRLALGSGSLGFSQSRGHYRSNRVRTSPEYSCSHTSGRDPGSAGTAAVSRPGPNRWHRSHHREGYRRLG